MIKNKFLFALAFMCCMVTAVSAQTEKTGAIVPQPNEVYMSEGVFVVPDNFILYAGLDGVERTEMIEYMAKSPIKFVVKKKPAKKNFLHLAVSELGESDEGYVLVVKPEGITITSASDDGVFYGIQSLIQLLEYYGDEIPAMTVNDQPRFKYRGLQLDVTRHYSDKEFVKKQLDMMARYKINTFHFHATNNEGWRMEIPMYPRLTEFAAWRPEANWFDWRANGKTFVKKGTPGAYGGYYTREDLKEIVEYARKLHIDVIPEVCLPGHSWEVVAAYPELSCKGEPYSSDDLCIGNEDTFKFLEETILYLMDIFPYEYFHIGGDEAAKTTWKTCPKCQARMKAEGLKDVDELQSYMIRRMQKFLSAHGRKLIGFDEIHQGGLAEGATVMSWRGIRGGMEAIAKGHHAIMTPDSYCYFDFYQDAPPMQPVAMAGFLPIEAVYSYDPAPDTLSAAQRELILGPQANMWAERMPNDRHKEYMLYPRLLALAEVAWTQPENKDFPEFRQRALRNVEYLKAHGYNSFDLKNEIGVRPESLESIDHLALGASVKYINTRLFPKYVAGGEGALTDGLRGGWSYSDGRWQGVLNGNIEVEIDLGKSTDIKSVEATFMQEYTAGIWMPALVEISVSEDGENFTQIASIPSKWDQNDRMRIMEQIGWKGEAKARYIRYKAHNVRRNGGRFLFLDEIVVR